MAASVWSKESARRLIGGRVLIGDVMSAEPLLLREDMRLEPAIELLVGHGYSGAPVMTERGQLGGMLHALDVAIMHLPMDSATPRPPRHILVREICREAVTISPARPMGAAAARMRAHGTDRLVVVDRSGHVVGVVTGHDLLRTVAERGDLLREIVDERVAALDMPGVRATVDFSGTVLLTGSVDSQADRGRLVRTIGSLDGVTEVDELVAIAGDPQVS
jgi:CBS domain-containing protein